MQLRTLADLAEEAPDFPWATYLAARGLAGIPSINVASFSRLDAMASLFAQTPKQVWRDYLVLRLLVRYGAYLPEPVAITTAQIDQLQTGTVRPLPTRRERASEFAQQMMPDVLAQRYVEIHLDPEAVSQTEAMAEHLRQVYRRRIVSADWLGEATRQEALTKLDAMSFIIGVPPDWNDYADYQPEPGDLFGNAYIKSQGRHRSNLARFRQRSPEGIRDIAALRRNIFFSPLQVGAYYLPRLNTIVA